MKILQSKKNNKAVKRRNNREQNNRAQDRGQTTVYGINSQNQLDNRGPVCPLLFLINSTDIAMKSRAIAVYAEAVVSYAGSNAPLLRVLNAVQPTKANQ
jgi:hypothetical protein